MNKREFLKTGGLLGVASLLPSGRLFAAGTSAGSCVLIPTETAGPFPLDLTANTFYFRQDVREDRTGARLRLRLRILGDQNCGVMENLRVNIWHCDADGVYSGYTNQNGGVDTTGLTFLRGYQITDANGDVEFLTIFPGWYPGRVCHIHFQVYVNSNYSSISQLTFPITEKQAVYTDNPTLYPAGTDPLTPSQDGIFSDGYQYQEATLTFNSGTQEYESYLEVTVQGTGVPTGLQEVRNTEQFALGQNQPNPFTDRTVIPFRLQRTADVILDLYDLNGRRVARLEQAGLPVGEHAMTVDLIELGLPPANYAYQLEITNASGTFRSTKLMTALR
ncbi:MAG: hypothetical protein H6594_01695 [Flavobacteriales bacterium]|nr:hypothetical protein [Flavobacteriales bacterium]